MKVTTQHVGYDRHDVNSNGVTLGRAWYHNHGWCFSGWSSGVEINITGRESLQSVAELAAELFKIVERS